MSINLKPETERLVEEEIQSGHFQSVDELILEGVRALREKRQSRHEAVRRLQEFAEKNRTSLEGVSVKDLIHEGHRL